MNHLPFTLAAYLFNSLSVLANKLLLNKTIPDPLIYIFYISLVSFLAVFALPFTHIPTISVWSLASTSTVLWTLGAYFMFKALKLGQVSRVIPIIGTLIPLILLIFASQTNAISTSQAWAVLILSSGIIFLTLHDLLQGALNKKEIMLEILSAGSFSLSYIILRQAYLQLDFLSVLVWSRLILLPFCILLLVIPALRRKIIASTSSMSSRRRAHTASGEGSIKTGLVFLGGQVSGTASELLLLFSISLANPALVNSLQGTQYVFLLLFALILGKKYPQVFEEKYTPFIMLSKLAGIGLIGIGLYLLAFANS